HTRNKLQTLLYLLWFADPLKATIKNIIPVISLKGPLAAHSQLRLATELSNSRSGVLPRKRQNFDGERPVLAKPLDQLGLIDDEDTPFRSQRHQFFSRQRAAAAFDHIERLVNFIRAINRQVNR